MSIPKEDMFTAPYSLTKTYHRDIYPAVDPTNPELSALGKVVVVTGAAGGVGYGVAKTWSIAGAKGIVLVGRNKATLEQTAKDLDSAIKPLVIVADTTSEADGARVFKETIEAFGKVDVLVNTAGTMQNDAPIATTSAGIFFRDFESNVKGTYNMVHHFIAATNGTGTIINFSSMGAALIAPGLSSYSISKLAVTRLGEYIHAEQPNIRVFSLHPGIVELENGRGMANPAFDPFAFDKPALSGGLTLYLATPKAEHLRGNYLSVNWDVTELEEHKSEFVEKKLGMLGFVNGTNSDGSVGEGGYKWTNV